jgi:hypothetical protein
MQPQDLRLGGGATHTLLNPVVAVVALFAGILMCVLPRRYVIVPFFAAAFLIPLDQVFVAGPLHFYMLRILLAFGWVRLLWAKVGSRWVIFSGGINGIDKTVILCSVISAVDFILLWHNSGAVINQLGTIYTVLGIYILLRYVIRNDEDLGRVIRVFAYVAAVIAIIMVFERATGQNLYSLLGGWHGAAVQERDGRIRAVGPFSHPILAGTFGAILFPLFVALWWKSTKHRFSLLLGILATGLITVASASSTPVLTYVAGFGALCLWPIRKQMRLIRWGIVLGLIALQIGMKAPVWALIARVNVVGGSSGYHRYMLVDQFIRHFGSWWLLGTKSTGQWGWDMWDLANQYVAVGEVNGLLPFIFFIATIVLGFKYLGIARKAAQGNKKQERFIWALGAALFANIVAFFGISYFDQTQVAWYALLAMISTATLAARRVSPATAPSHELDGQHIVSFATDSASARARTSGPNDHLGSMQPLR